MQSEADQRLGRAFACWGNEKCAQHLCEHLKEKVHARDISIVQSIILKWTLKQFLRVGPRFAWIMLETNGGRL
jgi:hypothetical protein